LAPAALVWRRLGVTNIVNFGSITGNTTSSSGMGVQFAGPGSVTNQSGAMISGNKGIYGNGSTVPGASAGTVVNFGSIAGNTTSTSGIGVKLVFGSVTNQSGGVISGFIGVYGGGGIGPGPGSGASAGAVVNFGSIAGNTASTAGIGVKLAGGSVTNQSRGMISGFDGISETGTVVNFGGIAGNTTSGTGVSGGSVINQSGGTISGFNGISGTGTVVNFGGIAGNTTSGTGVSGGSVTNQSGGVISGFIGVYGGGGIGPLASAEAVVNFGSITGNTASTAGIGVKLAGGSVTNQSGGVISGFIGVYGGGGIGPLASAEAVVNFAASRATLRRQPA